MGAERLSSRAIIGEFYHRLEQDVGAEWVGPVSGDPFMSDQGSEEYAWLGMSPVMREWVGGRQAKSFRDQGITIPNLEFEATVEVLLKELRRDKTGQIMVRIRELADRTNAHWAKLLSTLIQNAESTLCYDGEYFFDDDHAEGDSGTQDNDLAFTVVDADNPTAAEMETHILKAVAQILSFKDDQGEPMNEGAREFLVMVPINMMAAAAAAIGNPVIVDGSGSRTNTLTSIRGTLGGFTFQLAVNSRLTWTTKFSVFRTDGNVKPFIRQEEVPVELDALAEDSEEEFKNKRHLYGVTASRNVGLGYWQHACLVTFSDA